MNNNNVSIFDITGLYDSYREDGADQILLKYNMQDETLNINVRCTDDCEPYYIESEDYNCRLSVFTTLLEYIVNGQLVNEYGEQYPVYVDLEYPNS